MDILSNLSSDYHYLMGLKRDEILNQQTTDNGSLWTPETPHPCFSCEDSLRLDSPQQEKSESVALDQGNAPSPQTTDKHMRARNQHLEKDNSLLRNYKQTSNEIIELTL